MSEIVNSFLLSGDKFVPEMHLNGSGFAYSACAPFPKINEIIEKFMQTGNTDYIYKNDLHKSDEDVNKRTKSEKVLRDKAFEEDWLHFNTTFLIKNLLAVV